ncbi:MAG: hypothetical protein AB1Z98_26085 [Nannocystaceae bacterium]
MDRKNLEQTWTVDAVASVEKALRGVADEYELIGTRAGAGSETHLQFKREGLEVSVVVAPAELPFLTLSIRDNTSLRRYRYAPSGAPRMSKLKKEFYRVLEGSPRPLPEFMECATEFQTYLDALVEKLNPAIQRILGEGTPGDTKEWKHA